MIEKNKRAKFNKEKLLRIDCIDFLLSDKNLKKSRFIGSTGNTGRELYYLNEKKKLGHKNSFYNIGAMGHLNQIAFEIAQKSKKKLLF